MTRRRIPSALVVLVCALTLAGCAGRGAPQPQGEMQEGAQENARENAQENAREHAQENAQENVEGVEQAAAVADASDIFAKARAIAAAKGAVKGAAASPASEEAMARAALAALSPVGAPVAERPAGAQDPRVAFARAAERHRQAPGGSAEAAGPIASRDDPREIFRRAQEKARAQQARDFGALPAPEALAPAPAMPRSSLWMEALRAGALAQAPASALRAPQAASANFD